VYLYCLSISTDFSSYCCFFSLNQCLEILVNNKGSVSMKASLIVYLFYGNLWLFNLLFVNIFYYLHYELDAHVLDISVERLIFGGEHLRFSLLSLTSLCILFRLALILFHYLIIGVLKIVVFRHISGFKSSRGDCSQWDGINGFEVR